MFVSFVCLLFIDIFLFLFLFIFVTYIQIKTELVEDYKRITKQFKHLQDKFRRFEDIDHAKFKELWNMNAQTIQTVVQTVIKGDDVITSQILGLKWVAPDIPNADSVFHSNK